MVATLSLLFVYSFFKTWKHVYMYCTLLNICGKPALSVLLSIFAHGYILFHLVCVLGHVMCTFFLLPLFLQNGRIPCDADIERLTLNEGYINGTHHVSTFQIVLIQGY